MPVKAQSTWQQYRAQHREQMPVALTVLRAAATPHNSLPTGRTQSPLQKYRANPDLFYQNLGSPRHISSPSSYTSLLSTGLLRSRNELNASTSTAVLKRRMHDVLKLEDLRKAQEVAADMSAEEVSRLPAEYLETLAQTLDLILRKVRRPYLVRAGSSASTPYFSLYVAFSCCSSASRLVRSWFGMPYQCSRKNSIFFCFPSNSSVWLR